MCTMTLDVGPRSPEVMIMGGRGGSAPAGRRDAGPPATVAPVFAEDSLSALKGRMLTSIGTMQDRQRDSIVGLETVRTAFEPSWTSDQVTQALKELSRERKILLIPQENQKVLTGRRRESAVSLGGEDKHLVQITKLGRSSR